MTMVTDDKTKSITFHYKKSSHFKTMHVDGVVGGLAPNGLIRATVFNERWPIPQSQTFHLLDNRFLGGPVDSEGIEGVVREVEADLVMSEDSAKQMLEWLQSTLTALQEVRAHNEAAGGVESDDE